MSKGSWGGLPRSLAWGGSMRVAVLGAALISGGCDRWRTLPPPPSAQSYDGVPVAGNLSEAHAAGFTYCIDFNTSLRCRRQGIMLMGHGPFSAAVDLAGGDGRGGFDHLTLWHDADQDAAILLANDLERLGWQLCSTKISERAGDQDIYSRKDMPVRISIDVSYYGKRRIRVIPRWNKHEPSC